MEQKDHDHPEVFEVEKGIMTPPEKTQAWNDCPDKERKTILRKMDIRILPVVMLLYRKVT